MHVRSCTRVVAAVWSALPRWPAFTLRGVAQHLTPMRVCADGPKRQRYDPESEHDAGGARATNGHSKHRSKQPRKNRGDIFSQAMGDIIR